MNPWEWGLYTGYTYAGLFAWVRDRNKVLEDKKTHAIKLLLHLAVWSGTTSTVQVMPGHALRDSIAQ